jgi:hypothetical protein
MHVVASSLVSHDAKASLLPRSSLQRIIHPNLLPSSDILGAGAQINYEFQITNYELRILSKNFELDNCNKTNFH